jgi:hypothetical protein
VKVRVLDGTGTSDAAGTATALVAQGFVSLGTGTSTAATKLPVTQIRYGTNSADAAKTLLDYIPDAALVPTPSLNGKDQVELVLGESFQSIAVPPTTTTLPPVAGAPTTAPTTTVAPTTTTLAPDPCPN